MARDSDKTRAQIVRAADELFYTEGLRSVSVDEIALRAGITKKTLYYHYRSKDELIAAYMDARSQPTLDRFKNWAGNQGNIAERMTRLFQRLGSQARSREWLGCGFMRVTAELANMPGHPALVVARAHKLAVQEWLRDGLIAEQWPEPDVLARTLLVLIDGTVAQLLMHRDPAYAEASVAAVQWLLSPLRKAEVRSVTQRLRPAQDHESGDDAPTRRQALLPSTV
jgi:AcrR family transcriptional regulator